MPGYWKTGRTSRWVRDGEGVKGRWGSRLGDVDAGVSVRRRLGPAAEGIGGGLELWPLVTFVVGLVVACVMLEWVLFAVCLVPV